MRNYHQTFGDDPPAAAVKQFKEIIIEMKDVKPLRAGGPDEHPNGAGSG